MVGMEGKVRTGRLNMDGRKVIAMFGIDILGMLGKLGM